MYFGTNRLLSDNHLIASLFEKRNLVRQLHLKTKHDQSKADDRGRDFG